VGQLAPGAARARRAFRIGAHALLTAGHVPPSHPPTPTAADPGSGDPAGIEINFESRSIDTMELHPRLEKGAARGRGWSSSGYVAECTLEYQKLESRPGIGIDEIGASGVYLRAYKTRN
jgi:hypothetical protein